MDMYLKKGFSASEFLKAVRACSGSVICRTREGDVLNLKSQLCMYLFAAVSSSPEIMEASIVTCENEADYERLVCFLQMQPQKQGEQGEEEHVPV